MAKNKRIYVGDTLIADLSDDYFYIGRNENGASGLSGKDTIQGFMFNNSIYLFRIFNAPSTVLGTSYKPEEVVVSKYVRHLNSDFFNTVVGCLQYLSSSFSYHRS